MKTAMATGAGHWNMVPELLEAARSSSEVISAVKGELGNIYVTANGLRGRVLEKVDMLQAEGREVKAIVAAGRENGAGCRD